MINFRLSYRNNTMSRPPTSHEWSWNQDENINAENRYEKATENIEQSAIDKLQDYDTIVNMKEEGYRNDGVYIYYNKGIYNLSTYPDDYGSLPKWIKLQKDLGWTYFNHYLIDHNYCTPFKTSEWEINDSYVKKNNVKFPIYNCEIITNIKRNDGVNAIIISLVNISFPSMGGPSHDIILGTCGGGSVMRYNNYTDKHGDKFKITTYNETGKVIVSRGETEIEVDQNQEIEISPNVMAEACDVVNNKIKNKFNKNEYLYYEAICECEFEDCGYEYETVIAAKLDNKNSVYTVIPYKYD